MPLNRVVGVPHKGWAIDNVVDAREEEGVSYGDYENCEFCGHEQIRFVHILSHPNYPNTINVGCSCAERLTDDYFTPKRRETDLRNRASRLSNWLKKPWKVSKKGNFYLNTTDGYRVIVFSIGHNRFKGRIDEREGKMVFDSIDKTKTALFNALEKLRNLKI